jgi:hypothetical protein
VLHDQGAVHVEGLLRTVVELAVALAVDDELDQGAGRGSKMTVTLPCWKLWYCGIVVIFAPCSVLLFSVNSFAYGPTRRKRNGVPDRVCWLAWHFVSQYARI